MQGDFNDHNDSNKLDHNDDDDTLRDQLDYFVRLSQAQAEQIKKYKNLQQRSMNLIRLLCKQNRQTPSWKKQ